MTNASFIETMDCLARARARVIASLNQVRIMDAGWTSPPVTVKSHSSCVPLVHRLLLGLGFNLCPASKRRLIML